jgi:transposase
VPLLLGLPAAFLLVFMDKGYDADWLRIACAWYCDTIAIIGKRQWPKPETPEPIQKNRRWVVERGHAWRQRKYRRTNIRWERLNQTWLAFLRASLIHYWITILVG